MSLYYETHLHCHTATQHYEFRQPLPRGREKSFDLVLKSILLLNFLSVFLIACPKSKMSLWTWDCKHGETPAAQCQGMYTKSLAHATHELWDLRLLLSLSPNANQLIIQWYHTSDSDSGQTICCTLGYFSVWNDTYNTIILPEQEPPSTNHSQNKEKHPWIFNQTQSSKRKRATYPFSSQKPHWRLTGPAAKILGTECGARDML